MTREEAIKILKTERYCQEDIEGVKRVRKAYDMAIEALRAEPKQGEWVVDMEIAGVQFYRCDRCDYRQSEKNNYCPNCGCAMTKEKEE